MDKLTVRDFDPAGKRMLKGFDEPVTLYAVGRPARSA